MSDEQRQMRPYEGTLPTFLYRFRSVDERNIDRMAFEIRDCGIFLCSVLDFNDPEEGRPNIRFYGAPEHVQSLLRSMHLNQRPKAEPEELENFVRDAYTDMQRRGFSTRPDIEDAFYQAAGKITRVACFTENPSNAVMWSHYATWHTAHDASIQHGGVCLQYHVDDGWREMLRPVKYDKHRPTIVGTSPGDPADCLFVKGPDWAHEREWRMVRFFPAKDVAHPRLNEHSKLTGSGSMLAGVIFGINTPPEFKEMCRDWALTRQERPKFFHCVRQPLALELSIAECPL